MQIENTKPCIDSQKRTHFKRKLIDISLLKQEDT